MKIRQGHIRRSLGEQFPDFMARWGLVPYYDRRQPAVFFGCYGDRELTLMKRHVAPALVVWLGGDFALHGHRELFRHRPDQFTHIAIGKWLEADLAAAELPYKRVNLIGSPLLRTLKPVPLGSAVYSYIPHGNGKADNYGAEMLAEVQRLRPDVEYIVHTNRPRRTMGRTIVNVPREQMPEVYARCCLGLRFTAHDGGAETAVELGIMGRHCVHNGDIPNGIRWTGADDAVRAIDLALGSVGQTNEALGAEVRDHLQWDDDWLEVEA